MRIYKCDICGKEVSKLEELQPYSLAVSKDEFVKDSSLTDELLNSSVTSRKLEGIRVTRIKYAVVEICPNCQKELKILREEALMDSQWEFISKHNYDLAQLRVEETEERIYSEENDDTRIISIAQNGSNVES